MRSPNRFERPRETDRRHEIPAQRKAEKNRNVKETHLTRIRFDRAQANSPFA
jgi:hypothetical protein